jgi:PEP-CTERM motif
MKKLLLTISFAAALAGLTSPALAAPVDLTSWLTLGDSLVSSNSAKVTTAFTGEALLGSGALDIASLESQLSTASGTLGVDALEGSALSQSFNLGSSATLSFNWTLGADIFDAGFADLAFVLVDGTLLLPLANVSAAELSGAFTYTFSAGAHTLAFGVVDVNDVLGVSTLTVSDVNLATGVVPEPGSLALMLAGLGMLAWRARGHNR